MVLSFGCLFVCVCLFVMTGHLSKLAGYTCLRLVLQPKKALDFWSFCLHLPDARIIACVTMVDMVLGKLCYQLSYVPSCEIILIVCATRWLQYFKEGIILVKNKAVYMYVYVHAWVYVYICVCVHMCIYSLIRALTWLEFYCCSQVMGIQSKPLHILDRCSLAVLPSK